MKFQTSLGSHARPDWTPLLGMAFLLFALFTIASHLERIQAEERTRLPQFALARPPALQVSGTLVLDIVAPRTSSDNARDWVVISAGREMALADIESELDGMRRRLERPRTTDDVAVVVRADEIVPAGVVQQVIQACQAAGFTRFSLKSLANE